LQLVKHLIFVFERFEVVHTVGLDK